MVKLKVKLGLQRNLVLAQILEQDEKLRQKNIHFKSSQNIRIISVACPEIVLKGQGFNSENAFFIRGWDKRKDNVISTLHFDNNEDAFKYALALRQTINEFNNQ